MLGQSVIAAVVSDVEGYGSTNAIPILNKALSACMSSMDKK